MSEAQRRFPELVDEVMHERTRVIVERGEATLVAIVPLVGPRFGTHAGRELLKVAGAAGEEGEWFYEMMQEIIAQRRRGLERPVNGPQDPDAHEGERSECS